MVVSISYVEWQTACGKYGTWQNAAGLLVIAVSTSCLLTVDCCCECVEIWAAVGDNISNEGG